MEQMGLREADYTAQDPVGPDLEFVKEKVRERNKSNREVEASTNRLADQQMPVYNLASKILCWVINVSLKRGLIDSDALTHKRNAKSTTPFKLDHCRGKRFLRFESNANCAGECKCCKTRPEKRMKASILTCCCNTQVY